MQTYFWYFQHAWLHSRKMIEFNVYLHAKNKFHFFLTILYFKESCNLIGWQHFGPLLETQNYARYVGKISTAILVFIIDYFQEKLTSQNFSKNPKHPILGPFGALLPNLGQKWIFLEKRALSVFQYSNYLLLRQKSEKPNEPFLRKLLEWHTKNQFISLISLRDTANFRVLRLTEKSYNLIG